MWNRIATCPFDENYLKRFSASFLLICSYLLCNIGKVFSRDHIAPKLPYLTQCRNCKQRGSIYYFISEISFLAPRLFYSLICKCRLYFSSICKDWLIFLAKLWFLFTAIIAVVFISYGWLSDWISGWLSCGLSDWDTSSARVVGQLDVEALLDCLA